MKATLAIFSILLVATFASCGGKASLPADPEERDKQMVDFACHYMADKLPEPNRNVDCRINDSEVSSGTVVVEGEFQEGERWLEELALVDVTWQEGKWVVAEVGSFDLSPAERSRQEQEQADQEKKAQLEAEIEELQGTLEAFEKLQFTVLAAKFITPKESSNPQMHSPYYDYDDHGDRLLAVPIQITNPTQRVHKVVVYSSFETFLPPLDPADQSKCGTLSGMPVFHWFSPETSSGNWEFDIEPGSKTVNVEFDEILGDVFFCIRTEVHDFHLVSIDGFEQPSDVSVRISELEKEIP